MVVYILCVTREIVDRLVDKKPNPVDNSAGSVERTVTMATAAAVATALRTHVHGYVGRVKLHKLLYYCQAWHATWTGEPLFPERILAWEMGPVVADLWHEEKQNGRPIAVSFSLTDEQRRTLAFVISRYGELTGQQLIDQTHDEAPWRLAWRQAQNSEVEVDVMMKYFSDDPAADQAWFWDPEWLAGEREVDAEIARGDLTEFTTTEEFLASL